MIVFKFYTENFLQSLGKDHKAWMSEFIAQLKALFISGNWQKLLQINWDNSSETVEVVDMDR